MVKFIAIMDKNYMEDLKQIAKACCCEIVVMHPDIPLPELNTKKNYAIFRNIDDVDTADATNEWLRPLNIGGMYTPVIHIDRKLVHIITKEDNIDISSGDCINYRMIDFIIDAINSYELPESDGDTTSEFTIVT